MFLARQTPDRVHAAEKEASKITSCAEKNNDSYLCCLLQNIVRVGVFFKETAKTCPEWFTMRQSAMFPSDFLSNT